MNSQTITITSRQNPRIKELLKHQENYFFFEGKKLVSDILSSNQEVKILIIHESFARMWQPPPEANIDQIWVVSESVMTKLSALKVNPVILAVTPFKERVIDFDASRVIIGLNNLQDPGNGGTIFRCAAAFGIDGVAFTGSAINFNNSKFLRASQNALFHVNYQHFTKIDDLITKAEASGFHIYLTSSHRLRQHVQPGQMKTPCLVLLGNEGQGLDEGLLTRFPSVTIPHSQAVESLNVAVSACIIMQQLYQLQQELL